MPLHGLRNLRSFHRIPPCLSQRSLSLHTVCPRPLFPSLLCAGRTSNSPMANSIQQQQAFYVAGPALRPETDSFLTCLHLLPRVPHFFQRGNAIPHYFAAFLAFFLLK